MKKEIMAELEKCYSIAPLMYQGKQHFLVAAEKKDRCILFDAEGKEKATIWEEPGGTMSMVQVPGTDGVFLATHQFYSPNDSKEAKIILAAPDKEGSWSVKTLVELPFVHRFDLLTAGGKTYLIACTLKSGHAHKDDWSQPGKVYAAELPGDLSGVDKEHPLELKVIKEGLLKNHGYYRVTEGNAVSALVCSENGVFRFYPPKEAEKAWHVEQLLDTPASDAVLFDLNGDGENELVVLSPFHGDEAAIYQKIEGHYQKVYQYPEKAEFLHAVWAGKLAGKPVVFLGHRRGARRLFVLFWTGSSYSFKTIDDDCGAANVCGYSWEGKDRLIAANREINQIARYSFEDGDIEEGLCLKN
ncbi:MAG: hypothetical protein HFG50_12380 [Lachnospiraceae bacterium]|nr:hypothetical protein [Lachnospiraceae bacterium]